MPQAFKTHATSGGAMHKAATGFSAFTMAEMAAEVSRQTGKQIPYTSLPAETYAGILAGFFPVFPEPGQGLDWSLQGCYDAFSGARERVLTGLERMSTRHFIRGMDADGAHRVAGLP